MLELRAFAAMTEWVSITQAAERIGVSPDTIRRRLKRGELKGRQERTAQGFVWQIEVPGVPAESEVNTRRVNSRLRRSLRMLWSLCNCVSGLRGSSVSQLNSQKSETHGVSKQPDRKRALANCTFWCSRLRRSLKHCPLVRVLITR